jgi:hypothetical protein
MPIWNAIIGKYHPTFIGGCEKAIQWSKDMVTEWLKTNMLKDEADNDEVANKIVDYLSDHNKTKAHAKHIGLEDCEKINLKIERLEGQIDGKDLQDAVLSIHHSYMITFFNSTSIKIIENQDAAGLCINRSSPVPLFPHLVPQQLMQMPQFFQPHQSQNE